MSLQNIQKIREKLYFKIILLLLFLSVKRNHHGLSSQPLAKLDRTDLQRLKLKYFYVTLVNTLII